LSRIKWVFLVGSGVMLLWGAGVATAAPTPRRDRGHGRWFERACSTPQPLVASCGAQVVSNNAGIPLAAGSPPAGAYGPAQFSTAYSLPTSAPSPLTIGIVDAYDDPKIASDLATYSAQYSLPPCTTATGCFRKVNQNGGTSYPRSNSGWALEIALDVEVAHAICQNCKILLVEASSSSFANLGAAENEAVSLGANVVSNSWGGGEFSSETQYDTSYFHHPGVPLVFASGDNGYGVEYPAASQYVTAVGGTTLNVDSGNHYAGETAWPDAGSGCSQFEPKPSWQTDDGCARRTVADVSADADPNTGAAVYDSVSYSGQTGWFQVGGTSLATPLVAAVYALTGSPSGVTFGAQPYADPNALHDVTTGSNSSCGSYLCTAQPGYDGPTGLGTPNGLSAFTAGSADSVATPTLSLSTKDGSDYVPPGSTTVFYNPSGSNTGSFTVAASVDSSANSAQFPTVFGGDSATVGSPFSHTYTWTAPTSAAGTYQVTASNGSAVSNPASFRVARDVTSPTTTAACNGGPNCSGTYTGSVSVVLSSTDGSGAGVKTIFWRTDPSTPYAAYSGPLTVAAGTTVYFYAVDSVGNQETGKTQLVAVGTSSSGGGGSGSIALVQQTTASAGSVSTLTVPVASTAGDTLVATIALNTGGSSSVTSVTDSTGTSWTKGAVGYLSGVNTRVEIWYRLGANAVSSITIKTSTAKTIATTVSEWSGVGTVVDGQAGGSNASSGTAATPSLTTMNATDLVIGAINYPNAVTASLGTSGFTALAGFSAGSVHGSAGYAVTTSAGSYRASWTLSGSSGGSGGAIVALEAQ
jgi:hypothetical protein